MVNLGSRRVQYEDNKTYPRACPLVSLFAYCTERQTRQDGLTTKLDTLAQKPHQGYDLGTCLWIVT